MSGRSRSSSPRSPPQYHWQIAEDAADEDEGVLVIDAFEARTGELLWHGSARTQITPGVIDHERLRDAVESVLRTFPGVADENLLSDVDRL